MTFGEAWLGRELRRDFWVLGAQGELRRDFWGFGAREPGIEA